MLDPEKTLRKEQLIKELKTIRTEEKKLKNRANAKNYYDKNKLKVKNNRKEKKLKKEIELKEVKEASHKLCQELNENNSLENSNIKKVLRQECDELIKEILQIDKNDKEIENFKQQLIDLDNIKN